MKQCVITDAALVHSLPIPAHCREYNSLQEASSLSCHSSSATSSPLPLFHPFAHHHSQRQLAPFVAVVVRLRDLSWETNSSAAELVPDRMGEARIRGDYEYVKPSGHLDPVLRPSGRKTHCASD